MINEIHPGLFEKLANYDTPLIELFLDLREFILSIHPDSNELLYHTHALTSVYTPTLRMGDGFCHLPIYTNHLNLGFKKGKLPSDPEGILKGTGKLIRHLPVEKEVDFKNDAVRELINQSVALSLQDVKKENIVKGQTVCKYK